MSHPHIATEPTDGLSGSPSSPPGVDVKHVSATTLQAITYLFPKERGLALLTLLLGSAEVKLLELPDLGLVEVMKTSASNGDERDPAFLRRVLSGLQRL